MPSPHDPLHLQTDGRELDRRKENEQECFCDLCLPPDLTILGLYSLQTVWQREEYVIFRFSTQEPLM